MFPDTGKNPPLLSVVSLCTLTSRFTEWSRLFCWSGDFVSFFIKAKIIKFGPFTLDELSGQLWKDKGKNHFVLA